MIYIITNTITGDNYVGYSKDPVDRFKRHCYNSKSGNTYLYRAMRKYGTKNFEMNVLQEDGNLSEDETFWIKKLNPTYNMTEGGEGGDTSKSPNYKKGMEKRRSYSGSGNPQAGKFGAENPKSRKVKVDGIIYDSITEARKLAKRSFNYVKTKGEIVNDNIQTTE
jgi:group I intron endonuclease